MPSDGTKAPIAIRGIKADDPNKPPSRIELRDMRKDNPKQWNLFLLGMERFMDKSKEKEWLSFYQIAGIHGRPYTGWPNESWNQEKVIDANTGYCTHTSVLFLTWHRPYMALFEQALYKHVTDIASEYGSDENKDAYVEAAKDFRLPYWDWARQTSEDVTLFPIECLAMTKHQVYRPGGKGKSVPLDPNPLAAYRFGSQGEPDHRINLFPKVNATLRYPNATKTGSDEEVIKTLMASFAKGKAPMSRGKNLTERVLWILKAYTKFGPMCCNLFPETVIPGKDSPDDQWTAWGSLEDIHNAVHNYVGGKGQMGGIEVSAFDPIFWLHHNNIERLFAIWQALHNDDISNPTYVQSHPDSGGTRVIAPGEDQKASTPLPPFCASETIGDYWTSEAVKDTKIFGYVYPETRDWVYTSKEAILQALQDLYKHGSFSDLMTQPPSEIKQSVVELQSRALLHKVVAETPLNAEMMVNAVQSNNGKLPAEIEAEAAKIELPTGRDFRKLVNADRKYLEWLVDVKAEKHANNGDFVVHFFLGPPEDQNSAIYIFNPNHVASFSTLGQDAQTGCEKCQTDQADRVQVTGQVPLTLALVERYMAGQVDNLTVEAVEPYLARELHWRVTTRGGNLISRADINGLLVGVVTNEVTLPADPSGLPRYSPNVVPRPAATTKEQTPSVTEGAPQGRGDGTGYTGGAITVNA